MRRKGDFPPTKARKTRSWEAMRFCRVSLIWTTFQAILALLFVPHATSTKFCFEVARMIDNERLAACNADLARSDGDEDGELNSEELVELVGSLSQGRISVEEFRDLPLRLRMIYHWTACSCVFEPGANLGCCLGDNAHINIDEAESSLPFLLNRIFCSELTRGINKVQDSFPALPTAAPSAPPTVAPSAPPTVAPSASPSTSPSTQSPSASPSAEASEAPSKAPPPTTSPTTPPTIPPTAAPTDPPPETLCITFQYELVNNRSLTADDVQNEVDNTLKTGLIDATREIVIQLLNETFPRTARAQTAQMDMPKVQQARKHNPMDWKWNTETAAARHDPNDWSWSDIGGGRRRLPATLRQAATRADAAVLGMEDDMGLYLVSIHDELTKLCTNSTRRNRFLLSHDNYIRGSRRLVYYTDELPVEIPFVIDNPNCPSNNANGENTIRCAIVSSKLCLVLEAGDDAVAIRRTIIDGLSDAIDNGEFEDLIPQDRLEGDI